MSSLVSRLGGAAARGVALLVIATCTSDHIPTAPPPPQTAPVAPPPVSAAIAASAQAVQLIGAGNIARCDRTNDEATARSEERRVGKECRSRGWRYDVSKHQGMRQVYVEQDS